MFKVEVLYKEYANLYGDTGNIRYLEQIVKNIKIVYTNLNETPKFLTEKINLVYLGPMTEGQQEEVVKILLPKKKQIKKQIEDNTAILTTGNSIEIFGKYIEKLDKKKIKCLEIFDVFSKRVERLRHNDLVMGTTKDNIKIVGFKNQMSHLYGGDQNHFLNLSFGCGRNKEELKEGIRYKNFIGTYVIGPILPLNPEFAISLVESLRWGNRYKCRIDTRRSA